jgi:uncharacterized protein (TIGR02118 family)
MYKLTFCIRKRPDLDVAAFRKHWLEIHGPLARGLADALGFHTYIQSHTIEPEFNEAVVAGRGMAPPYDGLAQVWWNSVDEAMAAFNSPAGIEANKLLIEDEPNFVDLAACTAFLTEEFEIFKK